MFSVDEQYHWLLSYSDRIGQKGKPPRLPSIRFDNRLLLQMGKIMEEKGCSYDKINALVKRLFPADEIPYVKKLIETAVCQSGKTTDPSTFLTDDRQIIYPGKLCMEAGIRNSDLLKFNPSMHGTLKTGAVCEILKFAMRKNLKDDTVNKWLNLLLGEHSSMRSSYLTSAVHTAFCTKTKLRKNKSRKNGQKNRDSFMNSSFVAYLTKTIPSSAPGSDTSPSVIPGSSLSPAPGPQPATGSYASPPSAHGSNTSPLSSFACESESYTSRPAPLSSNISPPCKQRSRE